MKLLVIEDEVALNNSDVLLIRNIGVAHATDTAQLLNHFYKENAANENHGLGLSIVKQICGFLIAVLAILLMIIKNMYWL